jgi:hypothetical protein
VVFFLGDLQTVVLSQAPHVSILGKGDRAFVTCRHYSYWRVGDRCTAAAIVHLLFLILSSCKHQGKHVTLPSTPTTPTTTYGRSRYSKENPIAFHLNHLLKSCFRLTMSSVVSLALLNIEMARYHSPRTSGLQKASTTRCNTILCCRLEQKTTL